MVEAELLQFQSIMGEQMAARLELDRVILSGHAPERYQAVRTYIQALDQCIADLKSWSASVGSRIERDRHTAPVPTYDSLWTFFQFSGVGFWITSLRQERNVLAGELAAIDELNPAPHESGEPNHGTGQDL